MALPVVRGPRGRRADAVGEAGVETAIVGLGRWGLRVGELEPARARSVWDGLPSAAYLPPGVVADVPPGGRP